MRPAKFSVSLCLVYALLSSGLAKIGSAEPTIHNGDLADPTTTNALISELDEPFKHVQSHSSWTSCTTCSLQQTSVAAAQIESRSAAVVGTTPLPNVGFERTLSYAKEDSTTTEINNDIVSVPESNLPTAIAPTESDVLEPLSHETTSVEPETEPEETKEEIDGSEIVPPVTNQPEEEFEEFKPNESSAMTEEHEPEEIMIENTKTDESTFGTTKLIESKFEVTTRVPSTTIFSDPRSKNSNSVDLESTKTGLSEFSVKPETPKEVGSKPNSTSHDSKLEETAEFLSESLSANTSLIEFTLSNLVYSTRTVCSAQITDCYSLIKNNHSPVATIVTETIARTIPCAKPKCTKNSTVVTSLASKKIPCASTDCGRASLPTQTTTAQSYPAESSKAWSHNTSVETETLQTHNTSSSVQLAPAPVMTSTFTYTREHLIYHTVCVCPVISATPCFESELVKIKTASETKKPISSLKPVQTRVQIICTEECHGVETVWSTVTKTETLDCATLTCGEPANPTGNVIIAEKSICVPSSLETAAETFSATNTMVSEEETSTITNTVKHYVYVSDKPSMTTDVPAKATDVTQNDSEKTPVEKPICTAHTSAALKSAFVNAPNEPALDMNTIFIPQPEPTFNIDENIEDHESFEASSPEAVNKLAPSPNGSAKSAAHGSASHSGLQTSESTSAANNSGNGQEIQPVVAGASAFSFPSFIVLTALTSWSLLLVI